jgi:hypothetical protein
VSGVGELQFDADAANADEVEDAADAYAVDVATDVTREVGSVISMGFGNTGSCAPWNTDHVTGQLVEAGCLACFVDPGDSGAFPNIQDSVGLQPLSGEFTFTSVARAALPDGGVSSSTQLNLQMNLKLADGGSTSFVTPASLGASAAVTSVSGSAADVTVVQVVFSGVSPGSCLLFGAPTLYLP